MRIRAISKTILIHSIDMQMIFFRSCFAIFDEIKFERCHRFSTSFQPLWRPKLNCRHSDKEDNATLANVVFRSIPVHWQIQRKKHTCVCRTEKGGGAGVEKLRWANKPIKVTHTYWMANPVSIWTSKSRKKQNGAKIESNWNKRFSVTRTRRRRRKRKTTPRRTALGEDWCDRPRLCVCWTTMQGAAGRMHLMRRSFGKEKSLFSSDTCSAVCIRGGGGRERGVGVGRHGVTGSGAAEIVCWGPSACVRPESSPRSALPVRPTSVWPRWRSCFS